MEINIKKSGLWAFEGIWVEELKEGPQEMEDKKALELIDAGRAELVEEKQEIVEIIEPVKVDEKEILNIPVKSKKSKKRNK